MIVTIDDYQINKTVEYNEMPTSMDYSSNKQSVAMYPVYVKFKSADGTIQKQLITFLPEDKEHSHQQEVLELKKKDVHNPPGKISTAHK